MSSEIDLIKHVEESIAKAEARQSKLGNEILGMYGMSSYKNRQLLNNILDIPNANYLEIGLYMGATFISSLYENNINSAYAIDDWSSINTNAALFTENCNKFNIKNYTLFSEDSFKVDLSQIKNKINVYFYDGDYSEECSYKATKYYYDILDDEFILIVDDYDWEFVRNGIQRGINTCNLKILYERHLKSTATMDGYESWWNGIYIAVLRKEKEVEYKETKEAYFTHQRYLIKELNNLDYTKKNICLEFEYGDGSSSIFKEFWKEEII